ncbi:MAG TPA: DUF4336 domain-containing protein [Chthoniobacterales bacterium]
MMRSDVDGLQSFAEDIWIADGPRVRFVVASLPTRMIVVKLGDGSLWINSPVAVSDETLNQIETIGPIRYLVAPTTLHAWRLEGWRKRFPNAQLWGPPKVSRGSSHIAFTGLLQNVAPAGWARDLEQLVFKGNLFIEEVEFLHKKSRTLIITDFLQNYHAEEGDFAGNIVKKIGGVLNGGVPLDVRLSFIDRQRGRKVLARLLSWDFDKLIVAHGHCLKHDARALVENAFRWLSR